MRIEDKVELTKLLHKARSIRDIENNLYIDAKTRQRYTKEIQKNKTVKFLNVEYPLYIKKVSGQVLANSEAIEGNEVFEDYMNQSTVHPVFLPLNMTEVFMLTQHLLDICNWEDKGIYREIAEKIYSQLSDYAIERLQENTHQLEKREKVQYMSEQEMFDKIIHSEISGACKISNRVRVKLKDGRSITGKVVFSKDGEGKYNFEEDSGEIIPLSGDTVVYIEYLK